MLGKFFKPKWQHNDANVRLKSLSSLASDSVELIRIAQSDPDSNVRMEAITRLSHLPTLVQLGHTSGSIGERSRQRVIGLAASDHHHDHLLTDVFHWLQNPALLRSIARDSLRGIKLRHQAIAKLDDQELLFSIASNDTFKEIQYVAAKQITDLEKLKTLEKAHGKSNKRLRQLLKERLETEQRIQQQQAAINDLCAETENLANTGAWEQDKTRAKVLEQRWQKLATQPSPEQQARFQQALEHFRQQLSGWETEQAQRTQQLAAQAEAQARLQSEATQQAEQAAQAARERLEHEQQAQAEARQRQQQQKVQQEEKLQKLHDTLKTLEAHLDAEQYSEAIDAHKALTADLKDAPELPGKDLAFFQRRLHAFAPMLRELQDWRRWGTDQVRKQLIETAEHLRTDDEIAPQERAKKIHSLREEWRKLSQMEPGQQRALWQAFDANATAAYEPSKQYFVEQAQQRETHLQQRHDICDKLEALHSATDWGNVDWRSLQADVNQLRKQWKDAGTVSHKDWKNINERFNAAMDSLEAHFKAERSRNWQERTQLVEQAQALLEHPNTAQAVEQAKALQTQWLITLTSRPSDEQRLWKQFREPMDTLFARARDERQQQQQERNAQLAEEARQAAEQHQRELERQQQKVVELEALAAQSLEHKQAETSADAQIANRTAGELLCLQLEILLGLETPPDFQQARLKYQVAQLSETMRSRKDAYEPSSHALPLLKQWYALGGMPAAALASQTARIEKVKEALPQAQQ
ncbi:DUF349 domain-containing protein [Thiothrix litoralis]|uniref:DUF349 domain-containing protein n=2 Tax=Thiothrix litoralis TaxID=2891210 RepID=A0ABX7X1D1_9GAMM|nr:DUF349 domain-containing protein [Thiothrix litoralis]QTR46965.1 DUF349 domain-containing protein [Thiothrix litoralis]